MEVRCRHCGSPAEDRQLHKCPVCFAHFCEEHATVMSGRRFCSRGCADYFFFEDPEE